MSIDEQHVALPKLYGAPAYARPPAPSRRWRAPSIRTNCRSRPTRPTRSASSRRRSRRGPTRPVASTLGGNGQSETSTSTGLRPRAFSLRGDSGPARPSADDRGIHASGCSIARRGSSSIGQSGGLISRWFQVRVLAPLPTAPLAPSAAVRPARIRVSRWFRRAGAEAALARERREPGRDLIAR